MEQRKTGPAPTADEAFSDRPQEDIIAGRNAVAEALRAGRAIDSVLLAKGDRAGSISALAAQCRRKGLLVKEVDSRKLDALCGPNHQGIAALAACTETVTLDELFAAAEAKGEPPFFVVCDELEDPHNLGAILRTAETAGVHGVVIPKRRSAGLTSAVYKASAGAVEYVPAVSYTHLVTAEFFGLHGGTYESQPSIPGTG